MSRRTSGYDKKMEKTAEIFATNPGISLGESMRQAGYTTSYARASQMSKTDKWQKLMDKYFPDKKIALRINTLLDAPKVTKRYVSGKLTEEITQEDTYAISKGVEFALKAKGKLIDRHEVEHKLPVPLLDVSSHQVIEVVQDKPNDPK